MKKIIEYFYIFSKLTTSFIMFLIIFILGYLLYNSYKNIDQTNINLESKFTKLSNTISNNNENLKDISKKLDDQDNLNKKLTKNLTNLLNQSKNKDYFKEINDIKKTINNFQSQIDNILLLGSQNKEISSKIDLSIDLNQQISSLVNIISIKFKNGENVKNEIIYLENILPKNKNEIYEKLLVLELNKFYGLKYLNEEFDRSIKNYIKNNFLLANNSAVINFFSKFISIKPRNLNKYQNEELNILKTAKNFMEAENILQSLNHVLLIKKNEEFFSEWVIQANIYIDFINTIRKVI